MYLSKQKQYKLRTRIKDSRHYSPDGTLFIANLIVYFYILHINFFKYYINFKFLFANSPLWNKYGSKG